MELTDRKHYLSDIVQKILYSPNRTNRSNTKASTRVPKYREIFLSVANDREKTLPGGSSQKLSIRQVERIDQIDKRPPRSQNIVKYFANEMQMGDRKLYLSDRPKNSVFAK